MAEAGPSSPAGSWPKYSRTVNDSILSESSSKSIGLGVPPVFRNISESHDNGYRHNRRRAKPDALRTGSPGNKKGFQHQGKMPVKSLDISDSGLGAFSDEYDLAHEDPGIMEDVQRAVKMKMRREARLKAMTSNPSTKDNSDMSETSPYSPRSASSGSYITPPPMSARVPIPSSDGFSAGEPEMDFRPSVSVTTAHPVPRSADDGATLDWSADKPNDEKLDRRWSLSITKRKPKEKHTSVSHKPTAGSQSDAYIDKLANIKSRTKPLTLRKASMTADQLRRRYDILCASISAGSSPINLASVVRWHADQETVVRMSLERMEPSTWLKHLDRKPTTRSIWNVTALVVEEYMKSRFLSKSMQTIPEDSAVVSPEGSSAKSTYGTSRTAMSSHQLLNPSLARRGSYEGPSRSDSFTEHNLDVYSHRSESLRRAWIHSLQSDSDSQKSSILNALNWTRSRAASPTASGILHARDITAHHRKSDEVSSPRNSLSEGQPEDLVLKRTQRKVYSSHMESHSLSESGLVGVPLRKSSEIQAGSDFESIPTAIIRSNSAQETVEMFDQSNRAQNKLRYPLRRRRGSLPSSDRLQSREGEKRQKYADHEKERQKYEVRTRLLESVIRQNSRIRQILQRITGDIRDFDSDQSSLSELLGVPCLRVPREVLDALSHDPAVVTGSTRTMKGWRAVEHIHARVLWQRDVLQNFLTSSPRLKEKTSLPTGIFDGPLSSLMESIAHLEQLRPDMFDKEKQVSDLISRVRRMHETVKAEYNDTVTHTSQIYPEITRILALEENYHNRYHQFWDLGMDALTFILDSVTPFWRTYGKTIGIDIQDFLIVPWYRNEFTGELMRYNITHLPKRSFRHWLGLFLIPIITLGIMILQARAAVLSVGWIIQSLGFKNPGLWTFFLPLLVTGVIIQWAAVLVELCIILTQVGVTVWWMGWTVGLFT